MLQTHLFPPGLAIGKAFCDRDIERQTLKSKFLNHEHTVIVAPRRYGKSSLIKQVLTETKLPGKVIDLFPATNGLFIYRAIKECVVELSNRIAPQKKSAKEKLLHLVKALHPKLIFNLLGQQLEITSNQAPEYSIADLLVSLNTTAAHLNKTVIICFDEFQQIGLLKNHHCIEAFIRHAVESSTHVTYIFSGSKRHLLSQLFNIKSRPLYHLCELLQLDRIAHSTYVDFLMHHAKTHWKSNIDASAILEILSLTQCHAYYVNALCRAVWKQPKPPTPTSVQHAWFHYIDTQASWISDDLARLSPNQRNILAAIAHVSVTKPYSLEFSEKVKISSSSIKKSLAILLREDFVYKEKHGPYHVLDPAMKTYIHQIRYFDFL